MHTGASWRIPLNNPCACQGWAVRKPLSRSRYRSGGTTVGSTNHVGPLDEGANLRHMVNTIETSAVPAKRQQRVQVRQRVHPQLTHSSGTSNFRLYKIIPSHGDCCQFLTTCYSRPIEYRANTLLNTLLNTLYLCPVVSLSIFLLVFSSPNLILSDQRLDVCHISTHGVDLVRI